MTKYSYRGTLAFSTWILSLSESQGQKLVQYWAQQPGNRRSTESPADRLTGWRRGTKGISKHQLFYGKKPLMHWVKQREDGSTSEEQQGKLHEEPERLNIWQHLHQWLRHRNMWQQVQDGKHHRILLQTQKWTQKKQWGYSTTCREYLKSWSFPQHLWSPW